MRLATFNLMHGRSLQDGQVVAERVRDAIAALDVDVLGLQEVDRGQPRSGHADLTALAAEGLRAPYSRFCPAVIGTPGENFRGATEADLADWPAHDGRPEYGVALVSRWPVVRWRTARLPGAPVRAPIYIPGSPPGLPGSATAGSTVPSSPGGVRLIADEPRVLLAAVIQAPFGRITVATTHLSFVPGWNIWQLRAVSAALRGLPAPRILLADLNLPAALAGVASGWLRMGRQPTYPAPFPRVQFDHVLVDRRAADQLPRVMAVETPIVPFSDHRPLVIRLCDGG